MREEILANYLIQNILHTCRIRFIETVTRREQYLKILIQYNYDITNQSIQYYFIIYSEHALCFIGIFHFYFFFLSFTFSPNETLMSELTVCC